jgi:ABC-type amino acid transport substrate-binding protein
MRPICLAALALPACLLASSVVADLPAVQQRGTLRVLAVVVEGEPEFFANQPGLEPGFDQEVLQGFARLHRLRLEVVPKASWDALIPALLQGEGDVIAGRFTVTEARRKAIEFTVDVFPTRNVVLSRKPRAPVQSLADLRRQKIGVVKGTSMIEALAAAGVPSTRIDDSFPSGAIPAALRAGRITCTVDEIAAAIVAQRRDPGLQLGLFLGPPGAYAYGVRREDGALRAALNEYVENYRRTITWNRLLVKYFGQAAPEVLQKARAQ